MNAEFEENQLEMNRNSSMGWLGFEVYDEYIAEWDCVDTEVTSYCAFVPL